ncbi:MAG: hypothetical protein WBM24_19805 [Candidatus Sulfotelmatobacter sp.]
MTIYDTPGAAMRRLAELGIALEALQRAISAGHVARITCTENDPPFIPGTEAWRYTVVTLRDELCPRGWRKADPGNYSLVINDARQINIVVASGDAFTRRAHGSPRTKSLKGLYTEAATIRNRVEGDLFPETLADDVRRVATMLEYPTWILLIHITDDEYRAELSLPVVMEDDQITSWEERIFIPDSSDTSGGELIAPTADDHGPDIDVPVRRKA